MAYGFADRLRWACVSSWYDSLLNESNRPWSSSPSPSPDGDVRDRPDEDGVDRATGLYRDTDPITAPA
jgi:hypothetical protein